MRNRRVDKRFKVRDLRNGAWFWIHKRALEIISANIGPRGVICYNYLCYFSNNQYHECYPSISLLAKKCQLSVRSIRYTIKDLERLGLISVERPRGKNNVYTLLKSVDNCTSATTALGTNAKIDIQLVQPEHYELELKELELKEQYIAHLKILSQIKNYPYELEIDITMLEKLSERHSLNSSELLQILQDYSIAKLGKPLEKGDNPRLQINTFCKNYKRWHSKKNYQNDNGKPKKGLIASLK